MTKSPAFQFYPDDFLGSGKVGTMTAEEVGMYTLLLCLEWNEIGFVYDEEELSRWCRLTRARFRASWRRVSRCFVERDGRMFNPRLDIERAKQAEWREKSRKGGRASAEARGKGGSTTLEPPHQPATQPTGNTPSPSPTPVTTTAKEKAATRAVASWVVRLRSVWVARVGDVSPGQLGKALKGAFEKHGAERLERAMLGYIAMKKGTNATCRLQWFAAEVEVWVERTAAPIAVVDGEMSPTLELLTRPAMTRAS